MNRRQTALAFLLVASGSALAHGETDLALTRSYELMDTSSAYASLTNASNLADLKVSIQIQARYQFNARDDAGTTLASPDDDITTGFVIRRAKVGITGKVSEDIKGAIKFGFDRKTGVANLENANLAWKINDDVSLKVGQFKASVLREENVSSSRQLASERSATNETINQGYTQGVELDFGRDRWRGHISLNDGFGNDNTAFNAASESDYAVSARAEFLVGDADWSAFKQFTSFRGATRGGMVGIAAHHQSSGSTNPSFTPTTDMTVGTLDFSWVDDGWNFYAAGVWRNMDTGVAEFDDFGFVAQGGAFVSDQDELFARWDAVLPDDANGATSQDFNSATIGWNHYMIPESHAAKFTLDLIYRLDSTTESIVTTSDGQSLLPDSQDGQFAVTAQMQILF